MELFSRKNGQELFEHTCKKNAKSKYNINNEKLGNKIRFQTTTEKCDKGTDTVTVCIAIVTLLMRRPQYAKRSGELIFMESSSNLEEHNLRYFMICTHPAAGALLLMQQGHYFSTNKYRI